MTEAGDIGNSIVTAIWIKIFCCFFVIIKLSFRVKHTTEIVSKSLQINSTMKMNQKNQVVYKRTYTIVGSYPHIY